jgi:hypothetical protein
MIATAPEFLRPRRVLPIPVPGASSASRCTALAGTGLTWAGWFLGAGAQSRRAARESVGYLTLRLVSCPSP